MAIKGGKKGDMFYPAGFKDVVEIEKTKENFRPDYTKAAQIPKIRKKMVGIMAQEVGKCQRRELVNKLIPEAMRSRH